MIEINRTDEIFFLNRMEKNTFMDGTIWNAKGYTNIVDPRILWERFSVMLRHAGFQILASTEHHFDPQGYTRLELLAESHFAVHTFPEANISYFELSSCIEARFDVFVEMLRAENSFCRVSSVEKVVPPNFDEK